MKIFCIKELWKNDGSSNAIFFNFTDLAFLPLFFAYKIAGLPSSWLLGFPLQFFFFLQFETKSDALLFDPDRTVIIFLAGVVLQILLTQGTKWFGVHIFRLVFAMWVHIIVRRRLSKFIQSFALKLKFKSSRPTHGLSILGYIDVIPTFMFKASDTTCLRYPFAVDVKHLPQIPLWQHSFEILLLQTFLCSV